MLFREPLTSLIRIAVEALTLSSSNMPCALGLMLSEKGASF